MERSNIRWIDDTMTNAEKRILHLMIRDHAERSTRSGTVKERHNHTQRNHALADFLAQCEDLQRKPKHDEPRDINIHGLY